MKKFILFLFVVGSGIALYLLLPQSQQKNNVPLHRQPSPIVEVKSAAIIPQEEALFIPYWTVQEPVTTSKYTSFIYFGITPDINGINTHENGYANIPLYTAQVPASSTFLAVRITDKMLAQTILESTDLQNKIVEQTLSVQKKYNFAGILLDLEVSGIGFDSVTKQVTAFVTQFSSKVHAQHSRFATAVYGDAFYRARPYNVQAIGKVSDQVFVMAYDFHKAGGDPGPNFPFAESNADSYTFPAMITDFEHDVPKEKLTIVFGMFGYDWPVTDRGDSIAAADALSTANIQKSFIHTCSFSSCIVKRNASQEPSISYIDADKQKHIIWFEDTQSVQKKIDYVHTQGIGSIAFWANGYF